MTTSTSVRFLDDDDEEDEEEVDHPEEINDDVDLVGGAEADLMLEGEDGERILEEAVNSADDLLFIDSLDFGENQFLIAE